MNRLILFTPVGGTDPISSSNFHDGAFLHICRVYRPTDVILYMSSEILKNQEKDDRYRFCLARLCAHLDCQIKLHIIERRDLVKVYEFDWFYQEFHKIFQEIFRQKDDTDQLLVNISSGTPAMKSGLSVLMTIGDYPAKLIQVTTPDKKMNEHTQKGYDVELLWELDPDNEPDFKNRCLEIVCPTLSYLKNEETIKKYVRCYDYQAAVMLAKQLPEQSTKAYFDMLRIAAARKQLDSSKTDKLSRQIGVDFIPVKESDKRKYFEYALVLDIKQKNGEYADFLRALTPLIVDLYELVLKKQFGIDIDAYCYTQDSSRKWDVLKLAGSDLLDILDRKYSLRFQGGYISSDHLLAILDAQDFNAGNLSRSNLKESLDALRKVESKIRNLAAHEIICIRDEDIKRKTGFNAMQIMNEIKKVFTFTGINVRTEDWCSYEKMNHAIIEKIGFGD